MFIREFTDLCRCLVTFCWYFWAEAVDWRTRLETLINVEDFCRDAWGATISASSSCSAATACCAATACSAASTSSATSVCGSSPASFTVSCCNVRIKANSIVNDKTQRPQCLLIFLGNLRTEPKEVSKIRLLLSSFKQLGRVFWAFARAKIFGSFVRQCNGYHSYSAAWTVHHDSFYGDIFRNIKSFTLKERIGDGSMWRHLTRFRLDSSRVENTIG